MKKHLKILILGDDLSAQNQIVLELKKSELFFTPQYVNSKNDYLRFLKEYSPVVILADVNFIGLSPLEALKFSQENSAENSLIVLSDSLSDGYIESCIKAGADDYLLKKDLPLLSMAINSVLDRKKLQNATITATKSFENSLVTMFNENPFPVSVMRLSDGKIVYINDKFAELFGYIEDEIFEGTSIEINIWAIAEDRKRLIDRIKSEKILDNYELKFRTSSGTIKDFLAKIELFNYDGEETALSYIIGNPESGLRKRFVIENEARFKSFAENSDDIFSTHTSEGIITYISAACRVLLGYHPEELIGHSAYEFLHKEDLEIFSKVHQQILTTPESHRINYRIRKKDGSYLLVETIGKTLRASEHGQFIEMLFTTRSIIADLKLVETKEDVSKANAVQQILNGVKTIIWRSNAQTYQYTAVNQYAEELLGFPIQEWLTDPSFWIEHVHPEDREYIFSLKSENQEKSYTCDYRMISKSGNTIWIRENVNTIETASDVFERFGSMVDITDRKHAEEVLAEIQSRYQSFFENTNDGIIITTRDGKILATNAEACLLFGRSETEMLKSGRSDIMDTSDPKLKEALDERVKNGKFKGELTCVRKDGTKFQADVSTALFTDKEGNEIANTIIRDVTAKKLSENELRRKSILLNGILQNIPVAVYRLDFEGNYTESSGLGLKRLGLADNELVGLSIYDTYPQFAPKIMNALHTDYEHLIVSGDMNNGKWYYEHFVFREEESLGLVGFAFDITDRRVSENALKASEEKFRSLSAFYPVGIFITDTEGNCTWSNNRMQRIAGVSAEQAIGDGWRKNLLPEDKIKLTNEWVEYARKGWALPGSYRFLRPDETVRWVKATTSPLFSDQGDLFGHVGTIEDITDKKIAEGQLIQSEQKYKSLIDNNPDGVYSIDNDGNFTSVNEKFEQITGFDFEQLKKLKFKGLLANTDITEFQEHLDNILKGTNSSFQCDIKSANGDITKLIITKIPILLDDKVVGIYGIAKDITEKIYAEELLKHQNEELMKTNQELDQFVYSTSHDLRAPLTSVLGLIGLAKIESEPEQQQLYLDKMSQSVHKLDRFIQDIINYSKNSRLQIQSEEINLRALVDETVENLKYIEGAEKIDIRIKLDEKSKFFSDISRLRVILSNIISNAVRYHNRSETFPFIEFSATVLEDKVFMEISDNGQGINPIHLEKIFEMFYRASQNSSGSGLGLYIVKESVTKLKGKISVKSELNKGTAFYIQLPNLINQNAI